MDDILTKEIAEELMKTPGETRGLPLKQDGEYVLNFKGEDGLKKVEQELEDVGYPIKYEEIKGTGFYPAAYRFLSLLALKKVFGFGDKEIKKVCAFQPKTPWVAKLFMKYLYSVPRVMKKIQSMWRTYWTKGEMDFSEFNEKEKRAVIKIKDFTADPIWCKCVEGYLESMTEIVLGHKNIICTETKCPSRNKDDKVHEFVITW